MSSDKRMVAVGILNILQTETGLTDVRSGKVKKMTCTEIAKRLEEKFAIEVTPKTVRENVEKFKELYLCSTPARLVGIVIKSSVRLVPDLPVFHIIVVTVCPAFGVVHDDMLADARPLCKILWGKGVVFFLPMLNR